MGDKIEKEIVMVSAVSEALRLRKKNILGDNERIMKDMARFFSSGKREGDKLLMIASVSKALSLLDTNSHLTDKEVISEVMKEFPIIMSRIEGEDNFAEAR